MIIFHKISDFLFELFPKSKMENGGDIEILKSSMQEFYTFSAFRPKVSVKDDIITVEVDTRNINQDSEYNNAVALCEKQRYSEAKPILLNLIRENPTNSEFYRIYGQVLSDEGKHEEAINFLIDALRWNPKNGYALIMMGNIFSREKDDLETAGRYYDEAIKLNPSDYIAINNFGTNLLQIGKWEKGLEYLERAYKINPNYPNSSYGIALANDKIGNTLVAFDYGINALKNCGLNDKNLFNHILSLVTKTSEEWTKSNAGNDVFNDYKSHLENLGGIEIRVEEDSEIPTAAKIEFAENYQRDHHLVKVKTNNQAVAHLMMHELVHLDFVIAARKENVNKLFTTNGEHKGKFSKDHQKDIAELQKRGIQENSLTGFVTALFHGINLQTYNAPIDLFIEDFLFNNFRELRPFQFISLYRLATEYKNSVNNKQVRSITPKDILYASKVLNLVFVIHFKELFGVDLIAQFIPTPNEIRKANEFFNEFKEYQNDRKPGEEYELVQHWAEDLKLNHYFDLIDEDAFRQMKNTTSLLDKIENDPFDMESDELFKQSEMEKFTTSQKAVGMNMAVVMFMIDALKYFSDKSNEKTKKIALEIGMLGTQGIAPDGGRKYKLANIPGKDFSGYHLLAYYYVSWSLAIPEMLKELRLPYDNEYRMALKMLKE